MISDHELDYCDNLIESINKLHAESDGYIIIHKFYSINGTS